MASKKSKVNDRAEADMSGEIEDALNEAQLEELYAWVDTIPLSRPKKNIARDFSDGVLLAECIEHFFPKVGLIEMHNYSPANNTNKKKQNWYYLNRKVFSKMNFELAEDVINDVVAAKPGIIEKVLCMLRIKIERAKYAVIHQNEKPEADQHQVSPGRGNKTIRVGMDAKGVKGKQGKPQPPKFKVYDINDMYAYNLLEEYGHVITQRYLDMKGWNSGNHAAAYVTSHHNHQGHKSSVEHVPISKQKFIRSVAESESVSRILFEETEQKLLAKDEMIKILEAKISRLEHLLYLKDKRIDDLQARVEATRPTGIRK